MRLTYYRKPHNITTYSNTEQNWTEKDSDYTFDAINWMLCWGVLQINKYKYKYCIFWYLCSVSRAPYYHFEIQLSFLLWQLQIKYTDRIVLVTRSYFVGLLVWLVCKWVLLFMNKIKQVTISFSTSSVWFFPFNSLYLSWFDLICFVLNKIKKTVSCLQFIVIGITTATITTNITTITHWLAERENTTNLRIEEQRT